jgi:hypothetical protein
MIGQKGLLLCFVWRLLKAKNVKKTSIMSGILFHIDFLLSTSGVNLHDLIRSCFGVCNVRPQHKFQHTLNAH